jgi:GGDEF domain-containing protein
LIVVDPVALLPRPAIPFFQSIDDDKRLTARLNAALRVRALHATVMRRASPDMIAHRYLSDSDAIQDASVLLVGRGRSYAGLSVALGEKIGVVGALSIEAAAKHLNMRDLDGVVLADGFSARVVDAFLTVLTQDTRFRHLPIIATENHGLSTGYDLPNFEILRGDIVRVADHARGLVRQHAFEARLNRALKSIDAGGLLDPRTGLLTGDAFARDFARAIETAHVQGSGLSAARFAFQPGEQRTRIDAARIFSRLMRRVDFATLHDDGSIIVVFTETDVRDAQMIARRLCSVVKQTVLGNGRNRQANPDVTFATLTERDSAESLRARLLTQPASVAS